MSKISSVAEFRSFRERVLEERAQEPGRPTLVIGAGTCSQASGSNDIMRIVKRQILERNLHDRVALRITGCQGFCEMDPFILVEPGNHLYTQVTMDDVPRIVDATLEGGVVEDLLYTRAHDRKRFLRQDDIPFFKRQTRLILGQNQKLDPIRILDYVENGGYGGLEKVLARLDPDWIIE